MTEEVKEQVVVDPIEEQARESGWMPKEDWVAAGKDPGQWRSAELFVELTPLFERIDSLKREVRQGRRTMEEFKQHYSRVAEVEYQHALETLKKEKLAALEDGNAEKLVEVDEKIQKAHAEKAVRDVAQAQVVQQAAQEIHPDFARWVENNSWYASNTEMQAFADSIGQAYARANRHLEPKEVLSYVEKKVKQAYPDNFKNPNRDRVPAVETSRTPTRKVSDDVELNSDEEKAMKTFVKSGLMTEAEYKASIKKIRSA